MKKCPTCGKEFEDSLKFCQVDGAELVSQEPAFDPYATVVGHKLDLTPEVPVETQIEEAPVEAAAEVPAVKEEEPQIHETTGSIPIAPPDEVLDLPGVDPLKTMYVSEAELKEALGTDIQSSPPAEEPAFELSSEHVPPPSPFGMPDSQVEPTAEPLGEMETVLADPTASPFHNPDPAPVAEWTPPPAPDAAWQNQEIGSNTPFQPPPVGAAGQSKGLAIASLVCGVLSCLCCLPLLTGLAGIVIGFIAKKKADENPSEFGGRGLALGGMITGAIGILLGIIQIIWIVFFNGLALLAR